MLQVFAAFRSGIVAPLVPVLSNAAVPNAVPLLSVTVSAPVEVLRVPSPDTVKPPKEPELLYWT
jgi:hypothetical protein